MQSEQSVTIRAGWSFGRYDVGALLAGFVTAGILWGIADQPPAARFVLDMTAPVNSGGAWAVDLYVNTLAGQPFRTPVRAGRARYEWPCAVRRVTFLRLDPVQIYGAEAAIHSFSIEVNDSIVHRFTPTDLSAWAHVKPGRVVDDALILNSAGDINHIESGGLAIRVPGVPDLAGLLRRFPGGNQRLVMALFGCGIVVLLSGMFTRSGRFEVLVLVLIVGGVAVAVMATRYLGGAPPSIAGAVSVAAYAGHDKARDTYVLLAMTVIPAAVAGFVWQVQSRWNSIRSWAARQWPGSYR
jgi:hypothetical protein